MPSLDLPVPGRASSFTPSGASPRLCARAFAGRGMTPAPSAGSGDLFRRVAPGEPVPPPPAELVQWANNTLLATLAGTLYGGIRAHLTREPPSLDVHPQAHGVTMRARVQRRRR